MDQVKYERPTLLVAWKKGKKILKVTINAEDFDEKVHVLWDDYAAKKRALAAKKEVAAKKPAAKVEK